AYEGSRVIGFYGTPTNYRLGWNAWEEGVLNLWYDPIEDITAVTESSDLSFPPAFWIFAVKKTAANLIRTLRLKTMMVNPDEFKDRLPLIMNALNLHEQSLGVQCLEWQTEWKKFINMDLNT